MDLAPAHILVVEDKSADRELLAEFLRHAGHTVELAEADAGVERAAGNSYDLVILAVR